MPGQLEVFADRLRQRGYSEADIQNMAIAMGLTDRPEAEERPDLSLGGAVRDVQLEGPSTALGAIGQTIRRPLDILAAGGQAVVGATGSAVEALGAGLEESARPDLPGRVVPPVPGAGALGKALQQIGQDVAQPARGSQEQLTPESFDQPFWEAVAEDPVQALSERGLFQVPQLLAVMAGSGIHRLPAAIAFAQESGAAFQEAIDSGATREQAARASAVTGLANMLLEVKGMERVLAGIKGPKGEVKAFFANIGKAIIGEGSTETVQEAVGTLSGLATYAGDRGLSLNDLRQLFSPENLQRFGAAGLLGAVVGGGVATTGQLGRQQPATEERNQKEATEAVVGAYAEPAQQPEQRQRRVQDVIGRPDLANPGLSEAERDFTNAVLEERKRRPERVARKDSEVLSQAALRIEQNGRAKEAERFLAHGIQSDVDAAIAKAILRDVTTEALTSNDPVKLTSSRELILKYYDEGSEQARAFRFRRDMMMDPAERQRQALKDSLLYPSEALRQRLDTAKDTEDRVAAEAAYAVEIAAARQKIQEVGIDLDALLSEGTPITQEVVDQMVWASQLASATKASPGDKVLEYFRNAILSAPTTQMANLMGNTGFLLWEFYVQRPVEEALNAAVFKEATAAQRGEVAEATRALYDKQVLGKALQNMRRSFATEVPVFSEQFGDTDAMKADRIRGRRGTVSIAGPTFKNPFTGKSTSLGRVVRTPQRGLLAADEFAKTLIYEMALHTEAIRRARAAGDPSLANELTQQPSGEMVQAAYDESLLLTFQTQPGPLGQAALSARRAAPGLTLIAPFITTPTNILKISVKKSPLGILNVLRKYSRAKLSQIRPGKRGEFVYEKNEQVRDLAEQILAWGVGMMFLGLVGDDEEAFITGSASPTRGEREAQFRSAPPQSIRIGDQWYSYSRIEPFAFPLTVVVDAANSIKRLVRGQQSLDQQWPRYMSLLGSLVMDKTFMRGVSDLIEAATMVVRGEPGAVTQYATNLTTAFVPNIIRSARRARTEELKDLRPAGEGVAWAKDALTVAGEKAGLETEAPVRHDLWGRPIKLGNPTGSPGTDFLYRLVVPARSSEARESSVDRLILNYNNSNPARSWYPMMPSKTFTRKGKLVRMTRHEYQEYVRRSGVMAHARLLDLVDQGKLNVDSPGERDRKIVERIIRAARDRVKVQMFRKRE